MDLIAHTIHNYSDQIWMFPKLLDNEYADNVLNMLELVNIMNPKNSILAV